MLPGFGKTTWKPCCGSDGFPEFGLVSLKVFVELVGFHHTIQTLRPSQLAAPLCVDKVLAHEHDLYITFARRFIWSDGVLANGRCNSLTSPSLLRNEAVITIPSHVHVNCIFKTGKNFSHTGSTACRLMVLVMKFVNVNVFPRQTPWLSPNWDCRAFVECLELSNYNCMVSKVGSVNINR